MSLVWKHLGFVLSSLMTLAAESVRYLFTRNQLLLVTNLASGPLKDNVFHVKFFQAISADSNLLEAESVAFLSSYADNIGYDEEEVDRDSLLQLERNGLAFEKPASVVEPYRSGMVGLVYKATIRDGDDSKTVVAKVLRRGIRDKLRVALEEVQALLDVLTLFPTLRALNIANIFNENKDGMLEQLDTLRESNNIDTFYHLNENIDYAVVPKVYREASEGVGDRAIVMDFLEGRKLADLDIAEKKAYSACLAKFDIKCFLFDGYFHGDFHQGNLLFMGDARSPKIGIIDLGVMGVLSRDEQTDMYEFFKALLTRDYEGAAAAILATAAEPRKRVRHVVEQSGHELKLGLGNVLKCVFEEGKGCGMRDINRMNELLVEHGLSLSKTFCKAQLALGLSEGVHRGLETDTQFIDELEAACREMIPLDLI